MDNKRLAAYLKATNKTDHLYIHRDAEGVYYITDRYVLCKFTSPPRELAYYWPDKEGLYRLKVKGETLEEWGTVPDLPKQWKLLGEDAPPTHTLTPTRWGYAVSNVWYRKFVDGDHYTLISQKLTDILALEPDYLDRDYKYEQIAHQGAVRVLKRDSHYDLQKGLVETYTPIAIVMTLCKEEED